MAWSQSLAKNSVSQGKYVIRSATHTCTRAGGPRLNVAR
jgi:hypothetical protein